ncbi:MAG: DUF2493 domain-containing protein [Actinomycetota bacterium]
MQIQRVLVCGGRDYDDRGRLWLVLDGLADEYPGQWAVVAGGAPGADRLAVTWAHECGRVSVEFRADWAQHGRAAGPIRNQAMADYGADLVVAFPGGRGTRDMTRRARRAGVPVRQG